MNLAKWILFIFITSLATTNTNAIVLQPKSNANNIALSQQKNASTTFATKSEKKSFRQALKEKLKSYYGNNPFWGILTLGVLLLLVGAIVLTVGITSANPSAIGYGAVFAGIGLLIVLVMMGNHGGGGGFYRRRY